MSPLYKIPGFSIWRVWADAMHVLDLGVYQIIIACCLVELVHEGEWAGATIQERFLAAHVQYKAWCKDRNLQPAPRFKYTSLKPDKGCPQLTQHQAKAAQTRHMIDWVWSALENKGVPHRERDKWRYVVFRNWAQFERYVRSMVVICRRRASKRYISLWRRH